MWNEVALELMHFKMFLNFAQSQTALNVSQNKKRLVKSEAWELPVRWRICSHFFFSGSCVYSLWRLVASQVMMRRLEAKYSVGAETKWRKKHHGQEQERDVWASWGPGWQGPPTWSRDGPAMCCLRQWIPGPFEAWDDLIVTTYYVTMVNFLDPLCDRIIK